MTHAPQERSLYYSIADNNLLGNAIVRSVADEISDAKAKVLDVGCGSGAFAKLLGRQVEYFGIDLHPPDLRHADLACRATIVQADACSQFPFADSSFDAVVSFWCIEHLLDPVRMLRECERMLSPNGWLLIMFPNYDSPLRRCPSWWCSKRDDDSLSAALGRFDPVEIATQGFRRTQYVMRQLIKQMRLDLQHAFTPFEINTDPACKHQCWSRDRDAIHIVASRAVDRFARSLGLEPEVLRGHEIWCKNKHWLFDTRPERVLRYRRR